MDCHKNMTLKILLTALVALIFLVTIASEASASQPWSQVFGGAKDISLNSVVPTTDGGYAATGYATLNDSNSTTKVWLVKTDVNGNMLWNKTFGGSKNDNGYSLVQTPDGGYAIAGYTMSYGNGSMNVYLLKTDSRGNLLWNRTFGGKIQDGAFSLAKTSDNGLIITGFTYSFGHGGWDVYLIKTDANGNEQWNRTFGGLDKDAGHYVEQTADGGYIITGYTKSYGNKGGDFFAGGGEDLWLIKTDANGNEQWNRTYGGKDYDDGFAVHQLSDGGYIVAGTTKSVDKNGTWVSAYNKNDTARVYLIRTDSSGKEMWNYTYGGVSDAAAFSMLARPDGYIIAGTTFTLKGDADIFALKTDLNGTVKWLNEYGGAGNDYAFSIIPAIDNGYVLAGYTGSYGNVLDGYLIKIGDDGSGPTDSSGQNNQGLPVIVIIIGVIVAVSLMGAVYYAWKWYTNK